MNGNKNDTNPFMYCGEHYNTETESIYIRTTNYDSGTVRFTGKDPTRDWLNRYTYCGNNLIMFIDPSGKTREANVKYKVSVQKQLFEYSRKYNIAKRIGNK